MRATSEADTARPTIGQLVAGSGGSGSKLVACSLC